MCPENIEAVGMYSFQAEQWAGQDFQSKDHHVLVKGQNNLRVHRYHV